MSSSQLPRNASTTCFWHATGDLVCDTASIHGIHPNTPFRLNQMTSASASGTRTGTTTPTNAPNTESADVAANASGTRGPSPASVTSSRFADFVSFGQASETYNPTAYREHTKWYSQQALPCCDVPCKGNCPS